MHVIRHDCKSIMNHGDAREGRMKKQRTGAGMSLIGLGGVAAMLALAGSAHAESCGAVQAGWNVPAGGGVYTAGPGPFFSAMTAIGEFYSHSMLSRGPDGWV